MRDSQPSTFSFEASISQSVQGCARDVAMRVPFPVIFGVGAALGILLATLVVTLGHHGTSDADTMTTFAAPPAAMPSVWAPLPVVTIHPAPRVVDVVIRSDLPDHSHALPNRKQRTRRVAE